jgi:hypothetical protein
VTIYYREQNQHSGAVIGAWQAATFTLAGYREPEEAVCSGDNARCQAGSAVDNGLLSVGWSRVRGLLVTNESDEHYPWECRAC